MPTRSAKIGQKRALLAPADIEHELPGPRLISFAALYLAAMKRASGDPVRADVTKRNSPSGPGF
jgi:hypothetical protein